MVHKVVVIGAGIAGLSCATVIQEKFPSLNVSVIADKFSPGTTSDIAAGFWWPYLVGETPEEQIQEYSQHTYEYLKNLWKSPNGGKMGVSMQPCLIAYKTEFPQPPAADFVYGFNILDKKDLKKYNKPDWVQAFQFTTFTCEASMLLPYYLETFLSKNGTILKKHVAKLDDLVGEFDVIVNCTGLGARHLINDALTYPIRGQIFRVKAPWIKSITLEESDEGNYIIPNQNSVVLGGTHDVNDWSTHPRESDSRFIQNGCSSILPSLEKAEVIFEKVGLRPGRQVLRVESEIIRANGKEAMVIHNYGHGGSGLTLFWGCALKVADILEKKLGEKLPAKL